MADIDYPCRLSGVLVNSNSYTLQNLTERNDLSSGPPIYGLKDDSGYMMFDVAWSFNALEKQMFHMFFSSVLANGSKLFNIDLWVDGFDGSKVTRTHECYFDSPYRAAQSGTRWMVNATLLAINDVVAQDECNNISLVNAWSAFGSDFSGVGEVVALLEELWQP